MYLLRCLILFSVLPALPAYAQDSVYVGVGAGNFDYEESFISPLYGRVSDSVAAYKVFGGFEINEHFALEISYRETDDVFASGSATIDPFGLVSGALTTDFSMTSVTALGQLPFEWGALLGGLGYFSADNDFREEASADCCAPIVRDGSLSDDGVTATVGIEWRFGRFGTRYGVRLEYEWWDIDDADSSSIGVAFSYGF